MSIEITAKDLMATEVACTSSDALFMDVIQQMIDHSYSCMVVVHREQPIGIITERDIVRLMGRYLSNEPQIPIRVEEVMSVPVVSITEDTQLFEALVISTAQKIRHLPVIDQDGRLCGILTQSNMVKAHFRVLEKQQELIEHSVTQKTQELRQANEKLKSLSLVDALTGLGNRHAMEVDLLYSHSQASRYNRPYSVALFDVDFFKLYNDNYGHQAGDTALKKVAAQLQTSIRTCDRLYRYGGEEILLLMPETTLYGALILTDRILVSFGELKIPHEKSPFCFLTLSCGVASQSKDNGYQNWEELVDLADRGLYASKNNGRNQVTIIPPEDAVNDNVPRFHGNCP